MADCKLVVLISGNGSNLQAIIDAVASGQIPAQIAAVISNRADAGGLQRASKAGIPAIVVDHTAHDSRDSFDDALMQAIDAHAPDLVILAGFMRILSNAFVEHYDQRIVNIHPSLLPDLKGLNTHQRALDAGYSKHGASVHFVNKELDSGAVVLQAEVDILPGDDADSLAKRVLQQEHIIYPLVVQWFAENRLSCHNDRVSFDGITLERPLLWKNQSLANTN